MRCDETETVPDLAERDTAEILTFGEIPTVSCVHLNAFVLKSNEPDHWPDALCSNCIRRTTYAQRDAYNWKIKHFVVSHKRELSYYCDACYAPLAGIKLAENCRNCRYVYARKLQEILAAGYTLSSYPEDIIEPSEH